MKKLFKIRKSIVVCVLIVVVIFTGCGRNDTVKTNTEDKSQNINSGEGSNEESIVRFSVEPEYKKFEAETEYDSTTAVEITLRDNNSSCESDSVSISGNTISINKAGIYVLRGKLTDGNIIVDSQEDENVRLILDGVDITSNTTSPLYIKNAKNTIITLAEGTENSFKDSSTYQTDSSTDDTDEKKEPNAVIFSKDDLIINGMGMLNVTANYNHGIQSKDDLKIISGNINVESVGDSVVGKDSVVIKEGTINITSQQHGIKSTNYTQDKGYIYIGDAVININAEQDGINGVTCTRIDGGNINICAGDDGIHSDVDLTVDSGEIVIKESYEGIESQYITINNGNIEVFSDDDGFNASSGAFDDSIMDPLDDSQDMQGQKPKDMPQDMQGQKPKDMPQDMQGQEPENMPEQKNGNNETGQNHEKMNEGMISGRFGADGNCYLIINGGNIKVNAQGDGLDSNGYIEIKGGEIYIDGPTNGGNGAIDYGISCTVTGGILVAAGSMEMAEAPTQESEQYSVNVGLTTDYKGGTNITVKDDSGNVILKYTPSKTFQSFVFSTGELKEGKNYILYADDNEECKFTISDIITNVGKVYGERGKAYK